MVIPISLLPYTPCFVFFPCYLGSLMVNVGYAFPLPPFRAVMI